MRNVDRLFLCIAVLYVVVGMALGIHMSAIGNFSFTPVHAHMNLVGWASMALYALIYRSYPAMAENRLAPFHFWTANVGAILLNGGLAMLLSGMSTTPLVVAGSYLTLIGMLIFTVNVFLNAGKARSTSTEGSVTM